MKIFRFDRETGKTIELYSSSGFTLTRVTRLLEESMIQCAYLEPNGLIGYHQATMPQLFLIVQGDGWVRCQAPERIPIRMGQAAYWDEGEWHEARTQTGMTAIIIETARFDSLGWIPIV